MYIPKLNLAIECDEDNHKYRDDEYESKRQAYISSTLNCQFLRFDPDDEDFNINHVIRAIWSISLEK